jgi:hypothetical protein
MAEKSITLRFGTRDGDTVRRALITLGKDGEAALKRLETQGAISSRGLRAINAAAEQAKSGLASMAESGGAGSRALAGFGNLGLVVGGGIGAAVLAFGGLQLAVGKAMQAMDELQDSSERLGIGTEFLQAFNFAGQQSGVSIEKSAAALAKLSDVLGDIGRGGGESAKKALADLGISAFDASGKLKSVEQIMPELANGFQRIQSAAERASLANELFGRGNGQMVALLQQGSEALREQMQAARDTGAVLDQELVARLAALNDRMSAAGNVAQNGLTLALSGLAPYLVETAELFGQLAKAAGRAVDGMRSVEIQANDTVNASVRNLAASVEAQTSAITAAEQNIAAAASRNDTFAVNQGTQFLNSLKTRLAADRAMLQTLDAERVSRAQMEGRRNWALGPSDNAQNQAAILATEAARRQAAQAQAEATRQTTAALREELRVMKLSNTEREIERRLKEAGVTATSREGQEIRKLVEAINAKREANNGVINTSLGASGATLDLTQRIKDLNLQYQQGKLSLVEYQMQMQALQGNMNQLGQSGMNMGTQIADALVGIIDGSKSAKEALADLLKQFGRMLLNQAFQQLFAGMGGAGGGSLLGGLFGFADGGVMTRRGPLPLQVFANGGIANRPSLALFGEAKRPEAFVPLPDGRTIPVTMRGGNQQPSNINYYTYHVAPGVQRGELMAALKMTEDRAVSRVSENARRGRS